MTARPPKLAPSPTGRLQGESRHSDPLPSLGQTRQRLRYLAGFVRPYARTFWISIAAGVAMTLFAVLIPFLFRHAIDEGIVPGDMGAVSLFVGLALLAAFARAGAEAVNHATTMWSVRVLNDLRVALFAHVQKQGLDFFHDMRTGTVISRLTNDIDALENLVSDGIYMVFTNILTLLGIQVFLFYMNWRLALAVNVIFPVMVVITVLFRYYSGRAYRLTRERMAMVTAFLAESVAGMRVVQAFAAEDRAAREFEQTNERYRQANVRTIHLSALYFPGVDLLAAIGTAIVLWYGGLLAQDDLVEVGVLIAFVLYLNDFFQPIQQLSQFYGSFISAMAALDKIMLVMETRPTIEDAPDAKVLGEVRGDVRFERVSFRYTADTPEVLHDVDVHVPAGESVALVGHTGAGKSTFVKLLSRFYDPTEGRVLIDGVDIRELDSRWYRRQLGIVPQEGFLFSTTVAENIRFGRPDASDDDVRAAARAVGADEFIEELEHGYDTQVGERGGHLSAGQRQLIAFARAMLADPALLVLDEATSSVDVATELRLAAGLRTLVAGRTAFIVAHRLSTIRGADRILVIDEGRIVEDGSHDELIASGGYYASLYGTWTSQPETIEQRLGGATSGDGTVVAPDEAGASTAASPGSTT